MFFRRSRSALALSPTEVTDRSDVQVVDVRTTVEWRTGHVPGARHIPLEEVSARLDELDGTRPVAFICRSGMRSRRAVKLAAQAGIEAINITGGMEAWHRAGLPTSTR